VNLPSEPFGKAHLHTLTWNELSTSIVCGLKEEADPDVSFAGGPDAPIPSHALPNICLALEAYKRDLKRFET